MHGLADSNNNVYMHSTKTGQNCVKIESHICGCRKKYVTLSPEKTGEMAEWSIATVLKTAEGHTSGGSNPSLSATNAENQQIAKQTPSFTPKNVKSVFLFYLR